MFDPGPDLGFAPVGFRGALRHRLALGLLAVYPGDEAAFVHVLVVLF